MTDLASYVASSLAATGIDLEQLSITLTQKVFGLIVLDFLTVSKSIHALSLHITFIGLHQEQAANVDYTFQT